MGEEEYLKPRATLENNVVWLRLSFCVGQIGYEYKWSQGLKGRGHSEDLGVDSRTIVY
jgi:hypothetical protein